MFVTTPHTVHPWALLLFGALLFAALPVSADTDMAGYIESDLRIGLAGKAHPNEDAGQIWNTIQRLENTAGLRGYFSSDAAGGMADLKLVFYGGSQVSKLEDMSDRRLVDDYRLESDALFVEFYDILVDGLDLRLGRQIVEWGSADQFNPTNPVNALDLEDPVKFGDRVANEMMVLSWTAPWYVEGESGTLFDEFTLSAVAVPVFRTGILPGSGLLVFQDTKLLAQRAGSPALKEMASLADPFIAAGGAFSYDVNVQQPQLHGRNVQYGAHMGMNLLGVSLGFCYYRGFSDVPYPGELTPVVPPDLAELVAGMSIDEVKGLLESAGDGIDLSGIGVDNHVKLKFPRIQMVGGHFSTSLDFLGGLGFWGEVAAYFHEDLVLNLNFQEFLGYNQEEVLSEGGAFVKAAAGIDYSITRYWYMNVQYLYGFVDEFGATNLNHFMVIVNDYKLFNEAVLARVSVILGFEELALLDADGVAQVDDDGKELTGVTPSATVFPNLVINTFENAEINLGALIYLGRSDTKFGSPLAGSNMFYVKGKYSF